MFSVLPIWFYLPQVQIPLESLLQILVSFYLTMPASKVNSFLPVVFWKWHYYAVQRLGLYNVICWCHCVILFGRYGFFSCYGRPLRMDCVNRKGACSKNLLCGRSPRRPEIVLFSPGRSQAPRGNTPAGCWCNWAPLEERANWEKNNALLQSLLHSYLQSSAVVLGWQILPLTRWGRGRWPLLMVWCRLMRSAVRHSAGGSP